MPRSNEVSKLLLVTITNCIYTLSSKSRLHISMGKGGERVPSERAPTERPPFTVADLKKAIPPHCFKRSLSRSLSYLLIDLGIVLTLLYSTRYLTEAYLPSLVLYVAWPAYWIAQGCVSTGVWVIAHECGHQAFSEYGWINDSIGFFLHSFLMVPYFSWKYSHRRHHSNTGSVAGDEVFVPKKKNELRPYAEYLQHPFARVLAIFLVLTVGWPLYLAINSSGRKYDSFANHFFPESPIFNNRERIMVTLSDAGLITVLAILGHLGYSFGILWLLKVYIAPLLIVNGFLVLITFLQHTHRELPHYESSEWDWLRGALATIDRDYGFLNNVFHDIGNTHVAHHIFSTLPHYHAKEATEALKPILGRYYRKDETPILAALWREYRDCVFVAPDEGENKGVLWFHGIEEIRN